MLVYMRNYATIKLGPSKREADLWMKGFTAQLLGEASLQEVAEGGGAFPGSSSDEDNHEHRAAEDLRGSNRATTESVG